MTDAADTPSEPMLHVKIAGKGEPATRVNRCHKVSHILDILYFADTMALLWARLGSFEQHRRFSGLGGLLCARRPTSKSHTTIVHTT